MMGHGVGVLEWREEGFAIYKRCTRHVLVFGPVQAATVVVVVRIAVVDMAQACLCVCGVSVRGWLNLGSWR